MSNGHPRNINPNTGVSIGIVVLLLAGFFWVIKGQYDASLQKAELVGDIKELKGRMTVYESLKNSWTSTDMLKWAVHLQQLNKDPKKLNLEGLIVPEPEVGTK